MLNTLFTLHELLDLKKTVFFFTEPMQHNLEKSAGYIA